MIKGVLFFVAWMISLPAFAQDVLRNPAEALNPKAGRVLELAPIYEIRDDSGEFFFKYPYRFDLDTAGFLYVLDQDQLLKFSPEGKFIANLYKKGQGPGELASPFQMVSFFCQGRDLYVYDGLTKIIRLDGEGKLVEEISQTAGRFFRLMGPGKGGFFMSAQSDIAWGGGEGFKEVEAEIHLVARDGKSARKIIGFTSRIYQGNNFGMAWDNDIQVFDHKTGALYVSRTCEYQVVQADLGSGKTIRTFTRDYHRVPFVISDSERDFYDKVNPPKKDFANDIAGLFPSGGDLWVMTSTTDPAKGALFDVFDGQGRFVDSFFLGRGLNLALVRGGFVYVTEKDADENIFIKKLRIS